ncbi:MAG: NAD-dependent epimerase/dehydratase family protein [Planctomycetaceae bacterium]|jgi:farnesol dehydrogenase|nr:NAD-dependent epimerase/dehydratase family protein [Planctomycetaceae bacterium]
MDKKGKIFVTGSAGFIGAKLVQLLLREGFSVRGLYHSRKPDWSEFMKFDSGNRLEFVPGDILSVESLRKNMQGCRYIFHLAGFAQNWARDKSIFTKINNEGMRNVFRVAREQNVEKIVWTSSIVTLGPTAPFTIADETTPRMTETYFTEYEKSKALAEKEALQWAAEDFPVVIVNPTRVFGPGPVTDGNAVTSLIDDYINGKLFLSFRFGMDVGNYVYIDDVAMGHYLAMLRGKAGERYILGGENVSLRRFYNYVEEASGVKRRGIPVFKPTALTAAQLLVLKAKLTGGLPRISPDWVKNFAVDWAYSSEKAKQKLGYSPIPLKVGIQKTCDWLQLQKEKSTPIAAYSSFLLKEGIQKISD